MKVTSKHLAALKGAVSLLDKASYANIDCDGIISSFNKLCALKALIEEMDNELNAKASEPLKRVKSAVK